MKLVQQICLDMYVIGEQQNMEFDLVVVGAGVFGISTALFIATHYPQLKFALLEQFQIGHGEGSSHSQSRIIRMIYPVEFYRDLCLQGLEKYWPQVEKLLGDKFIQSNPCLSFVENEKDFKQYQKVAESSKGQLQQLSIEEVRKRFPSSPKININKPVFLDTKAGIVMAENYLGAAIKFLRGYKNITILEQTTVIQVDNSEKGVVLKVMKGAEKIVFKTKKVALSCGRWIIKLIPQISGLTKEVRQTVTYWQMKKPQEYKIGKFPAWIHYTSSGQNYYGLPDVTGIGIKYALHAFDASYQNQFASEQEYLRAMTAKISERTNYYFKDDYIKLSKIEKCYYTVIKSQDFLIDWRDQHQNVLICSPCSGHGFKFGPIIGKIIADLLVNDVSIQIFQRNRFLTRLQYHLGVNLK